METSYGHILKWARPAVFAREIHKGVVDVVRARLSVHWAADNWRFKIRSDRFYRDSNSDRWIQSPEC